MRATTAMSPAIRAKASEDHGLPTETVRETAGEGLGQHGGGELHAHHHANLSVVQTNAPGIGRKKAEERAVAYVHSGFQGRGNHYGRAREHFPDAVPELIGAGAKG